MGNYSDRLAGKKILVVGDEYLSAMQTARTIAQLGAVVVGPIPAAEQIEEVLSAGTVVCAVLLDAEPREVARASQIAAALVDRNIPVLIHSACALQELPPLPIGICILPLWASREEIALTLAEVVDPKASEASPPP